MATNKTSFTVVMEFEDGQPSYTLRSDWTSYDLVIDDEAALNILVLIAHQLIDSQDEQDQKKFEKKLIKKFNKLIKKRYNTIEPCGD